MKTLPFFFFLFFILPSCQQQSKRQAQLVKPAIQAITVIQAPKDTVFPDDQDTIVITTNEDRTVYTKKKLRWILKHYPELNDNYLQPDLAFAKAELEDTAREFSSEIGQDDYYVLYAYFQRLKHGNDKYQKERGKLIDLYNHINDLFDRLKHGGTYFSHQEARIGGYAAFDSKQAEDYNKQYDISKQKELYINSLKQLVEDETSIDLETPEADKPKAKADMLETVNHIDGLITNYFYLRMAQRFQYSCY